MAMSPDGGLVNALGLELGLELVVDLLDDLEVTRQQFADELGRPHFQGFRKQGVAGVVEGLVGDLPSGVPIVAVLVHEDAHELRNADDRVGVVELEGDLVREGGQIRLVLARVEDADGVVDGGGHEEVLLLEAQSLALRGGVFRIQDLGDVLSLDLRLDGVQILGLVEGEQIELVVALGGPQTQGVHTAGGVARNHVVDRDGAHGPSRLPNLLAVLFDDFAAEGDLLVAVVIDVAPRLFVGQPVIRGLDLLAVLVEFLLEDAVLVLDAVTERRHAKGGEESMKQAARRPRPPLPRPGSYSASMISWAENPRSLTALLNWSVRPALSSAFSSCLPMRTQRTGSRRPWCCR